MRILWGTDNHSTEEGLSGARATTDLRKKSREHSSAGKRKNVGDPEVQRLRRDPSGHHTKLKIWPIFERFAYGLRYAVRQVRRSPVFAITVISTLGLGIAAPTAMFSVIDRVLLEPVSYRDARQLVAIFEGPEGEATGRFLTPWLDIQEWLQRSRTLEEILGWERMAGRNYLEVGGSALQINGVLVSPRMFPALGSQPALGRGFLSDSDNNSASGNAGTLLLSYPVWQALGADPNVLGRSVRINDTAYTVIGIMPRGFSFPLNDAQAGQVWLPIQLGKQDLGRANTAMNFHVLGKLRKGVTISTAQAEIQAIQNNLATEYTNPDTRREHSSVRLERYGNSLVSSDLRKALLALLIASCIFWLIAGLNVANLLFTRGILRQREIAIRRALGADSWSIVQQMMLEGIVLSSGAAVLGIGLATGALSVLAQELTNYLPVPVPILPDARILSALVGLTFASALVSVAGPALVALRLSINTMLKQGGIQIGAARGQRELRNAFVTAEIAMSLALLVTCGLLLRTIYSLQHVPLGFRTDHVVVVNLSIPSFRFSGSNVIETLYQPLLERVENMHGTRSAGLISEVPLGHTYDSELTFRENGKSIRTYFKAVSPGVQDVLGLRMAAGRFFDATDTPTSQSAVIVNQTFAHLYSPNEHNPSAIVGLKLFSASRGSRDGASAVIIGVLDDTRQENLRDSARPEIDICISQISPGSMFYESTAEIAMDLVFRSDLQMVEIVPALRDVLQEAAPELVNSKITTMDQIVADSFGSQRLAAHLLEAFGATALVLSSMGVYGLLSFVVSQRTREIGIRIALGARRGSLIWLVLRQASAMLISGVLLGVALTSVSQRFIRGFLYGVPLYDAWTILAATTALVATGLIAAYIPARQAARVDPIETLRAE